MAAFNVVAFEHHCPACERSAPIRARTHVASAFDGIEDGPRFSNNTYGLGDRLFWYPPSDPRHAAWSAGGRRLGGSVQEACYAQCGRCNALLCAVLHFRDLRVVEVAQLAREEDWPSGFARGGQA